MEQFSDKVINFVAKHEREICTRSIRIFWRSFFQLSISLVGHFIAGGGIVPPCLPVGEINVREKSAQLMLLLACANIGRTAALLTISHQREKRKKCPLFTSPPPLYARSYVSFSSFPPLLPCRNEKFIIFVEWGKR